MASKSRQLVRLPQKRKAKRWRFLKKKQYLSLFNVDLTFIFSQRYYPIQFKLTLSITHMNKITRIMLVVTFGLYLEGLITRFLQRQRPVSYTHLTLPTTCGV